VAEFDVDAMLDRYRERAEAVKTRPMPPVEGEVRKQFIEQADTDYRDFLLVGRAIWQVEDNQLVLRIPLSGG